MKKIFMLVAAASALICASCGQKKADETPAAAKPIPVLSANCGAVKCI